jgi:hypothetical protein
MDPTKQQQLQGPDESKPPYQDSQQNKGSDAEKAPEPQQSQRSLESEENQEASGRHAAISRYLNHRADMKLQLDEWEAYAEENQGELPQIDMMETHNATEWIARAKRIGFPYMLSAQNFNLMGESRLPIVQRR